MSDVVSFSAGRRYSLQRVCRCWELARSTVYAWKKRQEEAAMPGRRDRRPGPKPAETDQEVLEGIREVLEDTPWVGEGYRKVANKLKRKGFEVGRERVRRIMGEANLLAPCREGRAHGPKAHDGSITPEQPDELWGADMTTTRLSTGKTASVFVVVDHASCECLGLWAAVTADRHQAIESLREATWYARGEFCDDVAEGIRLRHDHGSQYLSQEFQEELDFLGFESSPAFVREPEGNGCAERFIRTLKEQLLWLNLFDTIEDLRAALQDFKDRFNHHWIVERHGYQTPAQVRLAFELEQAA